MVGIHHPSSLWKRVGASHAYVGLSAVPLVTPTLIIIFSDLFFYWGKFYHPLFFGLCDRNRFHTKDWLRLRRTWDLEFLNIFRCWWNLVGTVFLIVFLCVFAKCYRTWMILCNSSSKNHLSDSRYLWLEIPITQSHRRVKQVSGGFRTHLTVIQANEYLRHPQRWVHRSQKNGRWVITLTRLLNV